MQAKARNQKPREEIMKHTVLFVFVFSIFLSGCNNTIGTLELKGKVIDEFTKTPVPCLSVMVEALDNSNHKYEKIFVGDFTTDSSGCFVFTLKKVKNRVLYNFCIQGNQDYDQSNLILGLTELNTYGKYLSFEVNKIVDFSMKINRESKTAFRDTLLVSWETNGIDGKTLYPFTIKNYRINSDNGLIWIGGDVKSEIRTKVYADKNTIVHWELYRNGRRNDIMDTIFCKRAATNSVNLTY